MLLKILWSKGQKRKKKNSSKNYKNKNLSLSRLLLTGSSKLAKVEYPKRARNQIPTVSIRK